MLRSTVHTFVARRPTAKPFSLPKRRAHRKSGTPRYARSGYARRPVLLLHVEEHVALCAFFCSSQRVPRCARHTEQHKEVRSTALRRSHTWCSSQHFVKKCFAPLLLFGISYIIPLALSHFLRCCAHLSSHLTASPCKSVQLIS